MALILMYKQTNSSNNKTNSEKGDMVWTFVAEYKVQGSISPARYMDLNPDFPNTFLICNLEL
jgi:hypothetical protein